MELRAADAVNGVNRGDVIVVIDVLRASSTIVTALTAGAAAVIPVKTIEEAHMLKEKHPEYILGGERGGLKPIGFDLGNSPREYVAERVNEREIVLSTSSGTQALSAVLDAPIALVGSFLNATAAADASWRLARGLERDLTIVLSGRMGEFSLEDFLCGGAILDRLDDRGLEYTDTAYAALLAYRTASGRLLESVLRSKHGRELVKLGLLEDVVFCCCIDKYSIVPALRKGRIVRLDSSAREINNALSEGD
jgi:2-phosphosulfolactate phosphatase